MVCKPAAGLALVSYAGFVLIGWNSVLQPSLIRSIEPAFGRSDAAFGLFYLVSALLYAGGSFGGGFLTERAGRRAVLALAALLMGLGLAGEALTPSWFGFVPAALAVNWGAGAIDGGLNGLFLDLYQSRGGALNRLHLFFSVGAFVSPLVAGQVTRVGISWRALVLVTGVAALAVAVLLVTRTMPSGRHERSSATGEPLTVGQAERSLWPFAGLAIGIACYVAAEMAVSSWLVRALAPTPVATATAVLSVFWGGLALGRLLANWVADHVPAVPFTVGSVLVASGALVAAVLVPWLPLAGTLYGAAGLCYGPVYPMIMALGGHMYPRRLAALSGSLSAAAVGGSVAYPPLVGLLAAHVGLHAGLIGAGIIGLPAALAVLAAGAAARRTRATIPATSLPLA